MRVGHGLQRRERLRRDDEERLGRIEVAGRLEEIGAIDVGNEAERERAIAVMSQRLVRHHGPEVGAADADIDDVADGLAGVALPFAAADAVGELRHPVEHGMNLRHHVVAVHDNRCSFGGAQRHMQHSALFGDIDFLAAEHCVAPLCDPTLYRELHEQSDGFIGNSIFGVVQVQACAFDRKVFSAVWIVRE